MTTLKDDQTILFTVPYDKGWIVTVDGVEVETYKTMDALIAFDIEESGEHELVLKYRPKSFVYGMAATVFFSLLFLGLCLLVHFMNKKGKRFFLLTGAPVRDLSEFDNDSTLSPEDLADQALELSDANSEITENTQSEQQEK